MKIKFFLLSLLISIQFSVTGQNQNYREIFGKRYVEAENFISQNRNLFQKYFPDSSEFLLATSIVFPEIIRFSELRDKIEAEALKTLYVQYGEKYTNFSVGPFQMKPTFAEQLEKDYFQLSGSIGNDLMIFFDTTSTCNERARRVERLSTMDGQLMYLLLFYTIVKKRFNTVKFESSMQKLRFFAAAYNSGYHNPIETIMRRQEEKHFHTEIVCHSKSPKYCYADISAYFFEQSKIRTKF